MIIIFLSILAGIFKSAADVLDTKFCESWFRRFKGNWFIDPVLSWENKHKFDHMFGLSFIVTPFSDLWHLLYTFMIICLISIGPFYTSLTSFDVSIIWNNIFTCILCAGSYCIGFEITYFFLLT